MRSQVITHSETLSLAVGGQGSTKLPVGITYGEIRLHVKGTYTIGTGALSGDAPEAIFQNVTLEKNNSQALYSVSGKDLYKINYYDQLGKVKSTAAAGVYEQIFKLNKAMILADADILPPGHEHPGLPIEQLNLKVTWTTLAQFFSTVGTATLDTGTLTITYDQIIMSRAEVIALFGPKLDKYALPKVYAKQTAAIATNTELLDALNIGTANLIRRAVLVTLNSGTSAEADDRLDKYAIVRTLPASEARNEIVRPWNESQADDLTYYGLDPLVGVTVIDYVAEVAMGGIGGILVEAKEEALKIQAKVTNAVIIRYIAEEYVVKRNALLAGITPIYGIPRVAAA